MDVEAIKEICKNKWTAGFQIDTRTQAALDKFDIWISQIPDEYKELSLILIQNLEYYEFHELQSVFVHAYKNLLIILQN